MRILVLSCRPPWPSRRGDQARTAGFVERLAARHAVHVVAQRWPGVVAEAPTAPPSEQGSLTLESVPIDRGDLVRATVRAGTARAGTARGSRPLQVALHDQPRFESAALAAVVRHRPDLVLVVLSRLGGLLRPLRAARPDLPIVVDLVDALSLNMARRAERDALAAPFWRRESRRLARWEVGVAHLADATTVVAERDRRAILAASASPGLLERSIEVVPFGVDLDALSSPDQPGGALSDPFGDRLGERRERVVLTGNLGYFPTVDGAAWFGREVWPLLRRARPEAVWTLAGARPAASLRRLAAGDSRIELLESPPSLAPILRSATVALAPLRAGSGTPIKILEAMAARVPVVATPSAADGLDQLPPEALAIEQEPHRLAEAISALAADPVRARRQAAVAASWLAGRHDLDAVARRFEELLERLVDRPARR